MVSYVELLAEVGLRARRLRLTRDLQQRELAARAGVGQATVQRFERTGRASMENALRIAFALDAQDGFAQLFEAPKYRSLDEALARPDAQQRQRVRRRK